MVELPPCDTNADLLRLILQSGRDYQVIAKTIYDLELVCLRMGGDKQPAILVTAGAHAGEPAGVFAALSLMNVLETEHAVYLVPLRDPFAWGGFARCLSLALCEDVQIRHHSDAERILEDRGTVVHKEAENSLVISFIGDLVFVSMRPLPDTTGPRDIERRLNRVLRDYPNLAAILAGKRLCLPSNLSGIEGCGDFERAFSAFVTPRGVIADLNRQFSFAYPPIEVVCMRRLADQLKPGLVLDLHEGQGDKFYLFMGERAYAESARATEIAKAILDGMGKSGPEPYRLGELSKRIGPEVAKRFREPIPGLMVGATHNVQQGATLGDYCLRYGPAFGLEVGRWKRLSDRVEQALGGALAAISAFEKQHSA